MATGSPYSTPQKPHNTDLDELDLWSNRCWAAGGNKGTLGVRRSRSAPWQNRWQIPRAHFSLWWYDEWGLWLVITIIKGGLIELYDVVHLSANSARSIHYSSHQISFQAAETLTSSCRMNLQAPAGPPPPAVSQPCKSCKWWEIISV